MACTMTRSECLLYAKIALLDEPAKPHIERAEPRGELLGRFVIHPLALMPGVNPIKRMKGWQIAQAIKAVKGQMVPQIAALLGKGPLPGRPMIRAIRFSSTEPDDANGWTKFPIDRLKDFGIILDDRPSKLNLKVWWEPAPKLKGFSLFEIYGGDG